MMDVPADLRFPIALDTMLRRFSEEARVWTYAAYVFRDMDKSQRNAILSRLRTYLACSDKLDVALESRTILDILLDQDMTPVEIWVTDPAEQDGSQASDAPFLPFG